MTSASAVIAGPPRGRRPGDDRIEPAAVERQPLQRHQQEAVAHDFPFERRQRGVDRHPHRPRRLLLVRGAGAFRDAGGVDQAEKQERVLVARAGHRDELEDLVERRRPHADLLDAFAQARLGRRLARLDMAGDDLGQLAHAGREMRRQAELAQQHQLAALQVERQHRGDLADVQHVAHARDRVVARAAQRHRETLEGVVALAEHVGLRHRHVGRAVGERVRPRIVAHRKDPIRPRRRWTPSPD
jgi:hypothetical protein